MSLHEGTGKVGFAPTSPGAASAMGLRPGMTRHARWILEVLHEDRDPGRASSPEQPSRRDQSRPRRGLGATPDTGGECDKHSIAGQFFDKKRGVAPSPDPDPDIHRPPSTIATDRTGIVLTGTSISTNKRGGPLTCVGKWLREWPR